MKSKDLGDRTSPVGSFFARTTLRVLGSYFEENGFTEGRPDKFGSLMFFRFGVFLEVSYELDIVPHAITIVIGIGDKKYDRGRLPCGVPYWYLLPRDRPGHQVDESAFEGEKELEQLLVRFRDQFIEPFAKPLWLNVDALERAISNFRAEFCV
jgi:hypothetical protein